MARDSKVTLNLHNIVGDTSLMATIVVPICSIRDHNKQDLEDLLNSIEPDKGIYSAIICCYDSCDEEFIEYFQVKYPWTHSLINKGNRLNFTRNSNIGLKFAKENIGGHIFLVNQDCILPRYRHMAKVCGEGLSTATSIDLGWAKSPEQPKEYVEELEKLQPANVTRTRLKDKHFAFYAPCFSPKVLETIGYMDWSYRQVYSDDDACVRTLLAGLPLEVVDVKIYHKGSHINTNGGWESRSGTYRAEDLELGLLQYRAKYNAYHVEHSRMIPYILENFTWNPEMRVD